MSREEDLTEDDLKEIVQRMFTIPPQAVVRSRLHDTVAAVDALRIAVLESLGQSLDGHRPDRTAQALVDRLGLDGHEHAGDRADILAAVSGGRESAWIALAQEYLRHADPVDEHRYPSDAGERVLLRQQLDYMVSEWRRFDQRISVATGIPLAEIVGSDGSPVIDWIEAVKRLLPHDCMLADSGLPDPAVLAAGGPRP